MFQYLNSINHHLAVFREMLITLGQEKDGPELREKIRKLRCTLLEECQITAQLLIPLGKCSSTESLTYDNHHHLVILFHLLQLFLRELTKSYRLTQVFPMDMNEYFGNFHLIYKTFQTHSLTNTILNIIRKPCWSFQSWKCNQ